MNRDPQRKNEEAEPVSAAPSEDLQGKPNCTYHAAGCADYRNGITDCSRCGFDRDEAERRRKIPFTIGADGLARKIIGRKDQ